MQVFSNQTGKFKHGDLTLAEDGFEFVICIDVALVDFVLKSMLLDVSPQFADHLSARRGR